MTYAEAIQFLYHLNWFGSRFGLANPFKLAALAGNPHHQLRFIHVAGTNGKGSTCAMLESIYRAAGPRVGLFTSPHLVTFGERIQVNRQLIPESEVARLVAEMVPLLRQGWGAAPDSFPSTFERESAQVKEHATTPAPASAAEQPTFFEVVTILALRYFADQKCDLVIWETGLGGRLDATNIVTPLASVITNIQFDHQQWLGDTLALIAAEKAGIIKPGVPVITATDAAEALEVIAQTARERGAPLTIVTNADTDRPPLNAIELALPGAHQLLNAALAVATTNALAHRIPVSEEAVRAGLSRIEWPGRLQWITRPTGQRILLDGAHNVAGARALAAALLRAPHPPKRPQGRHGSAFPSAKPTLLLGVLRDKDWAGVCRVLAPLASRILLTRVSSERTATPEELASLCGESNPDAQILACKGAADALCQAETDPFLLVTGSLYLVGEVLELLEAMPQPGLDERSLNEWTSPR